MIHSYFPNLYTDRAVGHTFKSICDGLGNAGMALTRYAYASDESKRPSTVTVLPLRGLRYTGVLLKWHLDGMLKNKLANRLTGDDWVYLWMDTDLRWADKLRQSGARLAKEMINCPLATREKALFRAHASIGETYRSSGSAKEIEAEIRHAQAMDIVFCPNPEVRQAMIDQGVDRDKCAAVSYGWSPTRLDGDHCHLKPATDELVLLFCGTVDVRKGSGTLLTAWEKADVRGKLLIAGSIDPIIAQKFGHVLARPDVVVLGHIGDVGSVYRSANAFVMPTWEEGGPMVTIEAMSQGLPCIATPMGTAGAFGPEDHAGIVFDCGDVDQLVSAIRRWSDNPAEREAFGLNAKAIAQRFTWEAISRRRAAAFGPHGLN